MFEARILLPLRSGPAAEPSEGEPLGVRRHLLPPDAGPRAMYFDVLAHIDAMQAAHGASRLLIVVMTLLGFATLLRRLSQFKGPAPVVRSLFSSLQDLVTVAAISLGTTFSSALALHMLVGDRMESFARLRDAFETMLEVMFSGLSGLRHRELLGESDATMLTALDQFGIVVVFLVYPLLYDTILLQFVVAIITDAFRVRIVRHHKPSAGGVEGGEGGAEPEQWLVNPLVHDSGDGRPAGGTGEGAGRRLPRGTAAPAEGSADSIQLEAEWARYLRRAEAIRAARAAPARRARRWRWDPDAPAREVHVPGVMLADKLGMKRVLLDASSLGDDDARAMHKLVLLSTRRLLKVRRQGMLVEERRRVAVTEAQARTIADRAVTDAGSRTARGLFVASLDPAQRRWVRAESVLMHVDSACTAALARMAPLRVAATELAERAAERERGGASAAEVEDGRNGDGALAEGAGEEGAPSEGGTPSEAYTPSEVSVEVAGSPPRSRVDGMSALGRSNGAIPGFYKARQFFIPADNAKDKNRPDIRTTLHWEPSVYTDDNGLAQVNFKTAAQNGQYRVIVEGISSDGMPLYSTTVFEVK